MKPFTRATYSVGARAVLAVALICATRSVATDKPEQITAYGAGNNSCGTYVAIRRGHETSKQKVFGHWLGGYITAHNAMIGSKGDILGGSDLEGAELWLENYCKKHPLEAFATAVGALVDDLMSQRQTVPTP